MDKTIAGLLGAVGALSLVTPGQSAPLQPSADALLQARTYTELLQPIPNALAALRAMDEAAPEARVQQAQLGPAVRDLVQGRDHHHHHRYDRRRYDRHHHHHHQEYDRRGSVFR